MKSHLLIHLVGIAAILASCDRKPVESVKVGAPLPPIALELADGSLYAPARGVPVVVSFVYSRCADICPLTLALLKQVHGSLAERDAKARFLLITVDPDRDRGAKFEEFLDSYEPSFIGLTGESDAVHEVLHSLGARFEKNFTSSADGYSMKHSADVIVVDRRGIVKHIFPFGTGSETITKALEAL